MRIKLVRLDNAQLWGVVVFGQPNSESVRSILQANVLLGRLDDLNGRSHWRRHHFSDSMQPELFNIRQFALKRRSQVLCRARFALGAVPEVHASLNKSRLLTAAWNAVPPVGRKHDRHPHSANAEDRDRMTKSE